MNAKTIFATGHISGCHLNSAVLHQGFGGGKARSRRGPPCISPARHPIVRIPSRLFCQSPARSTCSALRLVAGRWKGSGAITEELTVGRDA